MSVLPRLSIAFAVVALVGATLLVAQPSLTPPAGPIEESGRFGTLIELNQTNTPGNANALFVITEPGSYVLPANAHSGSLDGIHIAAGNVTIDLNGSTLSGNGASGSKGVVPILSQTPIADFASITLRNGVISGYEEGFNTSNVFVAAAGLVVTEFDLVRLEDLHITDTDRGIRHLAGGTIRSCIVESTETGILASNCTISDCFVRVEVVTLAPRGIFATNSTISDCAVVIINSVGGNGISYQLTDTIVRGSTATGQGSGFDLNGMSLANSCVANTDAQGAIPEATAIIVDCNF